MKEHLRQLAGVHGPLRGRNVAREYLQARILGALQRAGAMTSLAFHGGASLRFLFGLPRYSEDLDFALEGEPSRYDLRRHLRIVRGELSGEGYRIELRVREHRTVHSAFVRFPGTLYDIGLSPDPGQVLAVKIEVDTNPPPGAVTDTTLVRRHETLRLFHHDRASLLAGKLHAVLQRPYTKGRDIYDLMWYLSDPDWPPPNLAMLNAALRQTGWSGVEMTLRAGAVRLPSGWSFWTGVARRATCGRFWNAWRTSSWSTGRPSCGCRGDLSWRRPPRPPARAPGGARRRRRLPAHHRAAPSRAGAAPCETFKRPEPGEHPS